MSSSLDASLAADDENTERKKCLDQPATGEKQEVGEEVEDEGFETELRVEFATPITIPPDPIFDCP